MSPCPKCGAEVPPDALVCGTCQRLVHAELLGELAARARSEEQAGDLSAALGTWRSMTELLPASTRQFEQVRARILELSARLDQGATPGGDSDDDGGEPSRASAGPRLRPEGPQVPGGSAGPTAQRSDQGSTGSAATRTGLGALLLSALALLWKGKFLVLFAVTKLKVLLVGLTKLPTLLSMVFTVGVYTTLFGWKFALGFVLSIYVHEIGHVVALRRYGIPATAPMFVPGLGAFVRLKQYPATPLEDATVGLAGPLWGLGAAVACALWWVATGSELAAALAQVGAWLNLFNLLPVWQLDGGRGWHALDRTQRWLAVAALGVGWFISEDTLVLILAVVALFRAAAETAPEKGDQGTLLTYGGLVVALSAMLAWIPDPAILP